jgi:hypothetical protein
MTSSSNSESEAVYDLAVALSVIEELRSWALRHADEDDVLPTLTASRILRIIAATYPDAPAAAVETVVAPKPSTPVPGLPVIFIPPAHHVTVEAADAYLLPEKSGVFDPLWAILCPVCGCELVEDVRDGIPGAVARHSARTHGERQYFRRFPVDAALTVGGGKTLYRLARHWTPGGVSLTSLATGRHHSAPENKLGWDGRTFWRRSNFTTHIYVQEQDTAPMTE